MSRAFLEKYSRNFKKIYFPLDRLFFVSHRKWAILNHANGNSHSPKRKEG